MLPKNHKENTEKNREKRLTYFKERRTTSHWPCPVRVNGKQPNTWGDDTKKIDYDQLPKINLEDMIVDIQKLL